MFLASSPLRLLLVWGPRPENRLSDLANLLSSGLVMVVASRITEGSH